MQTQNTVMYTFTFIWYYIIFSAGQWLIENNHIQNKSFCVHNMRVCTVYIYYVYINTHTCMYICKKICTCKYIYSGGKIIWSPADFECLPIDKEIISLLLTVGLFKRWKTEQQQQKSRKTHLQKVINWFAFLWVK